MDLDPTSKAKFSELYPDFSARVLRVYEAMFSIHQISLRMTEGIRTFERQAELYAEGRTTPGPHATPEHPLGQAVTNALPGYSEHHYGIAADSCFSGNDPYLEEMTRDDPAHAEFLWQEFGRLCREQGLTWGGDFKSLVDRPHAELVYGGLPLSELCKLYQQGGLASVWARFDQIREAPSADRSSTDLTQAQAEGGSSST
jgi:peptidoglycan L-alanyl-D-glutamate endopeptidase CwlK